MTFLQNLIKVINMSWDHSYKKQVEVIFQRNTYVPCHFGQYKVETKLKCKHLFEISKICVYTEQPRTMCVLNNQGPCVY